MGLLKDREKCFNLECCISFSMTSYKRCDRLLNCEADFIKRFYPIYYNAIPYLLWLNVGKTKKANSGRKFPKLMARYLHSYNILSRDDLGGY